MWGWFGRPTPYIFSPVFGQHFALRDIHEGIRQKKLSLSADVTSHGMEERKREIVFFCVVGGEGKRESKGDQHYYESLLFFGRERENNEKAA